MKAKNIVLAGIIACIGLSQLASCQEEGLVMNSNDVSYVAFAKDMTKDTTRVCFEFYALENGINGKQIYCSDSSRNIRRKRQK